MSNQQHVIAKIEKNSREQIWVTLDNYRGVDLVNIRKYYYDNSRKWKPSTQGVAVSVDKLPDLSAAILAANLRNGGLPPTPSE